VPVQGCGRRIAFWKLGLDEFVHRALVDSVAPLGAKAFQDLDFIKRRNVIAKISDVIDAPRISEAFLVTRRNAS
jgi:hypothetical protein